MTTVAVDTSVVVPLLLHGHPDHAAVLRWAEHRDLAVSGHAETEAYSVLTRLPGAMRVDAASVATALGTGFVAAVHPRTPATTARIAAAGVTGGAVYDALVALAALDNGLPLATRDARAIPTYALLGVRVEVVA